MHLAYASQTRASLTIHLTSGVDTLKRECKQVVDALSTIEQYQYQLAAQQEMFRFGHL